MEKKVSDRIERDELIRLTAHHTGQDVETVDKVVDVFLGAGRGSAQLQSHLAGHHAQDLFAVGHQVAVAGCGSIL